MNKSTRAKLRKVIKEMGWSQREFADLVDVTECMVGHVLNGRRNFGVKNAKKVEALLGGKVTKEELCPDVY